MHLTVFTREAVPLWEAAIFTMGCMLLQRCHADANRIAVVLTVVAAILVLILMIALTPGDIGFDADTLDPGFIWPRLA